METNEKGGANVIIRDYEGFPLATKELHIKNAQISFQIEALAAFYAVEFAKDMGFQNIQLERDALTIVKSL